jgi:hypothetical protein
VLFWKRHEYHALQSVVPWYISRLKKLSLEWTVLTSEAVLTE